MNRPPGEVRRHFFARVSPATILLAAAIAFGTVYSCRLDSPTFPFQPHFKFGRPFLIAYDIPADFGVEAYRSPISWWAVATNLPFALGLMFGLILPEALLAAWAVPRNSSMPTLIQSRMFRFGMCLTAVAFLWINLVGERRPDFISHSIRWGFPRTWSVDIGQGLSLTKFNLRSDHINFQALALNGLWLIALLRLGGAIGRLPMPRPRFSLRTALAGWIVAALAIATAAAWHRAREDMDRRLAALQTRGVRVWMQEATPSWLREWFGLRPFWWFDRPEFIDATDSASPLTADELSLLASVEFLFGIPREEPLMRPGAGLHRVRYVFAKSCIDSADAEMLRRLPALQFVILGEATIGGMRTVLENPNLLALSVDGPEETLDYLRKLRPHRVRIILPDDRNGL